MDLYDRARLLDEGISNVQALAHHDLVDLLLETRVPAGRLVDWVDQSVLYLHCATPHNRAKLRSDHTDRKGARVNDPHYLLDRLHRVGIRTATDFEVAMEEAKECLLAHTTDGAATFDEATLKLLLTSLSDDEWLQYVKHWRRDQPVGNVCVDIDVSGRVVGEPAFVHDSERKNGPNQEEAKGPAQPP